MMTVPDCIVTGTNKLGHGHGEAKLYIASKDEMRAFYGGEKFKAKCFLLKSDLLAYMQAIKNIKQSIIINLLRQAVVLFPMMFILSGAFGITGVWIAFPIAEIATCIYSFFVFRKKSESLSSREIQGELK